MTANNLKKLSREGLQEIILKMSEIMSEEQQERLEKIIEEYVKESSAVQAYPVQVRMPQEIVDEKMRQIEEWMRQIDEGELYLNADEYEDYSGGYWDSDFITEYYDNQGIGDKINTMLRFAKDCVNDRKYQEASLIYEWLWEMEVTADEEYIDPADLELLVEKGIVNADMKQLALLTLYVDYQVREPDERAENIYLYFAHYAFQSLHIEDMLHAGRENLTETERFWNDWIALLKTKSGDTESRLLKEAVLYNGGIDGLVKMAEENHKVHPSLYLDVMKEYDKSHGYSQIEKIGAEALEKIDSKLKIRSKIALKAACAASYLDHTEMMMFFCWEGFCSDSTVRNLLRLFGMKEMAEQYGVRAKEILGSRIKGNPVTTIRNYELNQNIIGSYTYNELSFYTGNFKAVKAASKNPEGSLGWSSCFVGEGICLFLLYLFEDALPSKAASSVADTIGFSDKTVQDEEIEFEKKIADESSRMKTSIFWNYFQRWKQYFPMEADEKKQYLAWAENIVHSRAEAIVSGQHRRQYGDVAVLLAMVAEIKEQRGETGAKKEIFAVYKRKFPRHSSFQAEMKNYFDMRG